MNGKDNFYKDLEEHQKRMFSEAMEFENKMFNYSLVYGLEPIEKIIDLVKQNIIDSHKGIAKEFYGTSIIEQLHK